MGCMLIGANSGSAALPQLQPADGVIGGHEYVDFGLPSGLLWATCNVGAETPFETGDYYPWGDVLPSPKAALEEADYKFFVSTTGTRWIVEYIGDDITTTEYDAASANWGNGWRMPTYAEVWELVDFLKDNPQYSQTWIAEDGVEGMAIGNRMFLPAKNETLMHSPQLSEPVVTRLGEYASSTIAKSIDSDGKLYLRNDSNCGIGFDLFDDGIHRSVYPRWMAQLIRPVHGDVTYYQWKGSAGETGEDWSNGNSGIADVVDDAQNVTIICRDGRIVVSGVAEGSAVSLYDLAGRQVFTGAVADHGVDLPAITPGVYIATAAGKSVKVRM